jgi:Rod binding domain-containing protein
MFDSSSLLVSQSSLQDSQAARLLSGAKTSLASTSAASTSATATSTPASGKEDAKIDKAGKDFESILLGSWLTQAEQSFAKVPGGDGQDEDDDSGKDQFQGIAMQSLASSLTASGGIGIAKMITSNLHKASDHKDASAAATKVEGSSKARISANGGKV